MNLRILDEEVKYDKRITKSLSGMKKELGIGAKRKMRERIRQIWSSYTKKYEDTPVTPEILTEIGSELTEALGKYKGIEAQIKVLIEQGKFYIEPQNAETGEFLDEIYKETKNEQ